MTVDWSGDPTSFVARDWSALVRADPEATVFHTPRYLKLYWEEFGATRLQLAFVRRGDRDVAAAAFDLGDGIAAWLGGFEVTDYLGPVGDPEFTVDAARELMAGLAGRDEWSEADLAGLPGDGRWLPALVDGAREAGLRAEVRGDGVAPFLELPGSYDAYLAALPGKLRHELRRKERRLREQLSGVRLVDATPATIEEDLDRFVALHRSSGGEKGRFMVPQMELFFRRLAEALLPDGTFRLSFLEAEGDRVAGAVGFRFGERFLLYNSAYDHGRATLSPGIVLVIELIQRSIEEGCRTFDLLKGAPGYKIRFGARPRRVCRFLVRRR
jgi:CelD/BcsL family acetyltransferase involved in cellulose biosynthesis